MLACHDPEDLLKTAARAIAAGPGGQAVIDELPVPVYSIDTEGRVTYWNRACIEFAGREPRVGQDRWTISEKLFGGTGEPLLGEDCPMAQAIKTGQPVRDVVAIAERADGTRRAFRPYPTPLFDGSGTLIGAVNMLIDVTDEQSAALREQAHRCRRLADATYDRATSKALGEMASGYEKTADRLEARKG